jgi:hypothetical protein
MNKHNNWHLPKCTSALYTPPPIHARDMRQPSLHSKAPLCCYLDAASYMQCSTQQSHTGLCHPCGECPAVVLCLMQAEPAGHRPCEGACTSMIFEYPELRLAYTI